MATEALCRAFASTLERWVHRAACSPQRRPPDLHPGDWQPDELGALTERAREVCGNCPVRHQCLDHAMTAREPVGIWGGLDPQQRRRVT